MKEQYLDLTKLIERLHRRFLDVLRTELNRLGIKEINGVQALLLANIGDEDIIIRDLVERGYYQGSNVSYNIKKLVDFGYLEQERVEHDRRSVRVKLTDKARDLVAKVRDLQIRNAQALAEEGLDEDDVKGTFKTLRRLERTWADYIQYGNF